MEQKITITFRWWRDKGEVLKEHREFLEEDALERIKDQWEEGMSGGELHSTLLGGKYGKDEIDYQGWWELTTETIK